MWVVAVRRLMNSALASSALDHPVTSQCGTSGSPSDGAGAAADNGAGGPRPAPAAPVTSTRFPARTRSSSRWRGMPASWRRPRSVERWIRCRGRRLASLCPNSRGRYRGRHRSRPRSSRWRSRRRRRRRHRCLQPCRRSASSPPGRCTCRCSSTVRLGRRPYRPRPGNSCWSRWASRR